MLQLFTTSIYLKWYFNTVYHKHTNIFWNFQHLFCQTVSKHWSAISTPSSRTSRSYPYMASCQLSKACTCCHMSNLPESINIIVISASRTQCFWYCMNSTCTLTQIKGVNAAPYYPFDATLKRVLYGYIIICNSTNKYDMIHNNESQIIAIKTATDQILFYFFSFSSIQKL